MRVFGLEGPHEFKSFGVLEPTLVIHWQFLNELNEGQLHLQVGRNGWQSGLEMNYYEADPRSLPPSSERNRASWGTLGTKADFFFFQIITAFFCTGRPIHYQYCHLGSLLYPSQVKRTAMYFHINKSLENTHVSLLEKHLKKHDKWWESPGGPVVKDPPSSGQGAKIPHNPQPEKWKHKKEAVW